MAEGCPAKPNYNLDFCGEHLSLQRNNQSTDNQLQQAKVLRGRKKGLCTTICKNVHSTGLFGK